MSDIQPGDVVECIKCDWDGYWPWLPIVGSYYRVSDVDIAIDDCVVIDLAEDPFPDPGEAWDASWFRKLEPAEDGFTEAMRNLLPIEGEPA